MNNLNFLNSEVNLWFTSHLISIFFIYQVIRHGLCSLPHSCGFSTELSLLNISPDWGKKGQEKSISVLLLLPRKNSFFFPMWVKRSSNNPWDLWDNSGLVTNWKKQHENLDFKGTSFCLCPERGEEKNNPSHT